MSRAVRSGRLIRVRQGYFARAADPVDPVVAARAAALACTGSVISHRSAALVHGLPVLTPPPRPEVTVPPGRTGDVAAALLHRATLLPEDVAAVDGVDVTRGGRTAIDVARSVPLAGALVTMDAALHTGLTDVDELEALIARCANWPGIRRARRAIALADPLAESPLESVSRLVINVRLHLPAPRTQAVIRDEYGVVLGRCDFYWDEFGVFGEADGRNKYDGRDVLTKEKRRQEELEDVGLIGVRWGWREAWYDHALLGRRIAAAFERGRLRDASGFPRRWSVDDQ